MALPDEIPLDLRLFAVNEFCVNWLQPMPAASAENIRKGHPRFGRIGTGAPKRAGISAVQRGAPDSVPADPAEFLWRPLLQQLSQSAGCQQQAEHRAICFREIELAQLVVCDPAERRNGTGLIRQLRSQDASPEMEFHFALRIRMLHSGKVLPRNHQQPGLFPAFSHSA